MVTAEAEAADRVGRQKILGSFSFCNLLNRVGLEIYIGLEYIMAANA